MHRFSVTKCGLIRTPLFNKDFLKQLVEVFSGSMRKGKWYPPAGLISIRKNLFYMFIKCFCLDICPHLYPQTIFCTWE